MTSIVNRIVWLKTAMPAIAVACSHGLRMTVNLVIIKMIAVYVGPTGLGMLGNFMSLTTMAAVFAGGGIGGGITKYVAQFHPNPIRRIRFINSAMTYGTTLSLIIFIATVIGRESLAAAVLNDSEKAWLMPLFGLAQLLCFIGTATIAVVNGQHRSDIFAKITITSYLAAVPIAYLLVINFGIDGGALGLMLTIACTAGPSLYYVIGSPVRRVLRFTATRENIKKLCQFSLMVLTSAILFPMAEITIRNQIIEQMGYQQAGIWQGITRLSSAYIGFFSVFLATHYMPKISGIFLIPDLISTVRRNLFGIGATFLCFATILNLNSEFFINLLFSEEFYEISNLIKYQLTGDLFKLLSFVIGFIAVAKASVRLYILGEVTQTSLYTALTCIALQKGADLNGVLYCYIATYIIYFSVCLISLNLYTKDHQ